LEVGYDGFTAEEVEVVGNILRERESRIKVHVVLINNCWRKESSYYCV